MSVIEIRSLSKLYLSGSVKALDSVSLSIERGEMTAITGPSGSGKSTLMNMIGCLDTPTSGAVIIDGEPTSDMNEEQLAYIRNRKIGFVFQSFNLLPRLTALENVMTPLIYARVKGKERRARAEAMLEKVGLSARMGHLPAELSGGQKQRVAIARALVTDPAIILADEPTGALDSSTGKDVMSLFHSLNREGITIVIVTHDESVALQCGRQIRIRDGRIDAL